MFAVSGASAFFVDEVSVCCGENAILKKTSGELQKI